MAHYKETEREQGLFLTINLLEQLIPGTYEYTLTRLIDKGLDLSIFDRKYNNDYTGAAAIEPRLLLKIGKPILEKHRQTNLLRKENAI